MGDFTFPELDNNGKKRNTVGNSYRVYRISGKLYTSDVMAEMIGTDRRGASDKYRALKRRHGKVSMEDFLAPLEGKK